MKASARPHFVTTVHGLYSVSWYSAIMARGERVIAVSETVRRYVQQHYPQLPSDRIQVIQRGVDPTAFPYGYQPAPDWLAAWHQQYPQLRGQRILTLPGRLSRLKGHEDFIELLSRLRERGLAVYGLVVGGVESGRERYANELRQQVHARGLESQMVFTGHRADMREIYAISTVVLSLSAKPESFGRTVLEALSLGTPVVGYDQGGVGEILGRMYPDGRIPVGDITALTQSVEMLLMQAPIVPLESAYPLQRMLDETLALYQTLVDDQSAR
jgi:glycosyltransferase involved in cell wall biosynthesis